ncbi:hypothetical protein NDU88_005690 [Pleurodeles waltl]|uniref:Uncharacterized protein n=1 Tax=Pleurodeles waltl TaxID=8319 RepID=A0AAV7RJB6_PLEWA|nr:hypothetical protein NDU88_005690 [Pleurodeles waltl]
MRLEIAGFQSQISGLDHQVAAVESQVVLQTDRDQELLYLCSKLTDLEDRSRRNNICFLGFPEGIEGTDILSYLRDTLPKLADITFDPPLEFQRAHRLGLKRQNGQDRPRPIIACFLRHGQVRQLLQLSRRQGPLRLGPLEIHLSADFSKETADRRRGFLSFRPRLRHLDVKFGLFEPARMWITKNGESRTFYDPEDLKSFLEGLHDPTQSMESTTQPPQDTQNQTRGMGKSEIALDTDGRPTTDPQTRGRDLERRKVLLYLRSKLTDLEDRSRRNNIRFLGFPEGIEGTDILSYLRDTLPKLADITFDPPLEFQRAHRLGLKRQNGQDRPRPIIACFLRHGQVRQLLQLSRRQGPLRLGPLEIHLSADFSKETADRRRGFLSFRPRLRHLDVKFGLFEPARMWITKNGESRTFYDPEDLKSFLEGLHDPTQSMESTTQPPQDTQNQTRGMGKSEIALDTDGRPTTDPQTRGRDLERLTKSFDDWGQVLQAVAMHTQLPDRDKSRSPLKP